MRVFLAATLSPVNFLEISRPKYALETFFEGEKACQKALKTVGAENFLLDSGAFSYMSGAPCTMQTLEEYCDRYIKFIKENNVKYFFELDVDTIFGIEFVEKLRRKIEKETGKKPIPVWHKSRGVEYWKKMCAEYEYVAIGGLVFHVKQSEWDNIRKMVRYARQRGVKVHGLGFTKTKLLKDFDFYSVDSTSYKMSAIRGQQFQFFDGEKIVQRKLDKPDNKKAELKKLAIHNANEWVKYQRYMDGRKW